MSAQTRREIPTLAEAAAVIAAVNSYRQTLGLPPGDAAEMRLYLAELKQSIERLEHVTLDNNDPDRWPPR